MPPTLEHYKQKNIPTLNKDIKFVFLYLKPNKRDKLYLTSILCLKKCLIKTQ